MCVLAASRALPLCARSPVIGSRISAARTRAKKMSRVYIGRLSYRAREKDVERFFKGYGKILEVDLKNG